RTTYVAASATPIRDSIVGGRRCFCQSNMSLLSVKEHDWCGLMTSKYIYLLCNC
ncbi:unnamed protein product, partial [Musa acuminata subsp. burmannicoides]